MHNYLVKNLEGRRNNTLLSNVYVLVAIQLCLLVPILLKYCLTFKIVFMSFYFSIVSFISAMASEFFLISNAGVRRNTS